MGKAHEKVRVYRSTEPPTNQPGKQTKKQLNNSDGNINNIVMAINDN